jgi:hypothetical protein
VDIQTYKEKQKLPIKVMSGETIDDTSSFLKKGVQHHSIICFKSCQIDI